MGRKLCVRRVLTVPEGLKERRAAHVAAPRWIEMAALDSVRAARDADLLGRRDVRTFEKSRRGDELEDARRGGVGGRRVGALFPLLPFDPREHATGLEVHEDDGAGSWARSVEQAFRVALGL